MEIAVYRLGNIQFPLLFHTYSQRLLYVPIHIEGG